MRWWWLYWNFNFVVALLFCLAYSFSWCLTPSCYLADAYREWNKQVVMYKEDNSKHSFVAKWIEYEFNLVCRKIKKSKRTKDDSKFWIYRI